MIASGAVAEGAATLTVPGGSLRAGSHSLVAEFAGDGNHDATSATTTLTVTKARPKLVVAGRAAVRRGDRATAKVTVTAAGGTATGKVRFVWTGEGRTITVTRKLDDGRATAQSKPFRATGTYRLRVEYLGTA